MTVFIVTHYELIAYIRRFADELEQIGQHNRPDQYGVGGSQYKMFLDCGIEVLVKVFDPAPYLNPSNPHQPITSPTDAHQDAGQAIAEEG